MKKLRGYLNEIGHFKLLQNEENNIFIDRFKKLVSEVRSIDAQQVPTYIGLMAVLKEAWAHFHFAKNMSLDEMLETIAKWKPKAKRSSDAVANYTALPGNLKKAFAKKQSSGRGSGKDKVGRVVVETRACLACKKVGHLVKDCRNKEAKDAWLAKREKKQSRHEDDDSSRGRKQDRHPRERSDSRGSSRERERSQERDSGRSSSRERSNGRNRPNDRDFKKKKKTSQKWMSSDGEDLSDGDDSADGFVVGGEVEDDEAEAEHEEVEGKRVARVLCA